jgi:hypothetical protein
MRRIARLARYIKPGKLISIALISACILCARPAHAFMELNAFYFSDTMNTGTAAVSTRMFIETALGFMIDKNSRYFAGWAYAMHSASDSPSGTAITYASTEMGPRFVIMIDKAKEWSLGFGYYLVTKATYNPGTSEEWKGTALKIDLGYNFNVNDAFQWGARLNYSSATYTEKLVGAAYSTSSNSRIFIYPSVYTMWIW